MKIKILKKRAKKSPKQLFNEFKNNLKFSLKNWYLIVPFVSIVYLLINELIYLNIYKNSSSELQQVTAYLIMMYVLVKIARILRDKIDDKYLKVKNESNNSKPENNRKI